MSRQGGTEVSCRHSEESPASESRLVTPRVLYFLEDFLPQTGEKEKLCGVRRQVLCVGLVHIDCASR